MNLTQVFVENIRHAFPNNGEKWLADLPDLLNEAARRWNLRLGEPFLLSYNYVCAATMEDGSDAVLKIGIPNRELRSEINALRVYAGIGACRLLEADAARGMFLLERLRPGRMLVTLEDDDEATAIAAEVMLQTHRPAPEPEGFISLKGWFDELKGVRKLFHGGTGPFPEKSFALAEGLIRELFEEEREQVLLHGDFHHYNILSSQRGWLVIDPKGVIGPAEYEVGPLLLNPLTLDPHAPTALQLAERRMSILAERTGFEKGRIRAWAICHSVLSSFWDMNEDGKGGETAREWTEVFIKCRG